jgi:hypothetical protein
MDSHTLLYLLELYKITKIGGPNSPYACAEWPGIQIPQALLNLLDSKGLQFTFLNYKRKSEDHILHFYERNPEGRGLDFDDYPENKSDFVMYAVELRCLNPVVDIKKNPAPAAGGSTGGSQRPITRWTSSSQGAKEGAGKTTTCIRGHEGVVPR